MRNLEEKIEKAILLVSNDEALLGKLKLYKRFISIYAFTTENIKGYLKNYNLKNATVLTVGASGDHLLNLILLGATTIDYFDINPFTEFFVELKLAAVKALQYEEFIDYFSFSDWTRFHPFMSIKLYHKISPYLNPEIRMFWDALYLEFSGEEIRFSKLFETDEPTSRILSDINLYLEKDKFYKLKEILLQNNYKLYFYEKNFKYLSKNLKKSYKAILLSNIAKYLYLTYNYDKNLDKKISEEDYYLQEFKKNITDLTNYLDEKGTLFIVYLYDMNREDLKFSSTIYPIYDNEKRSQYFPEKEYQLFKFEGINQIKYGYQQEEKDAVLILQK